MLFEGFSETTAVALDLSDRVLIIETLTSRKNLKEKGERKWLRSGTRL